MGTVRTHPPEPFQLATPSLTDILHTNWFGAGKRPWTLGRPSVPREGHQNRRHFGAAVAVAR